jgi:hypothetical protein
MHDYIVQYLVGCQNYPYAKARHHSHTGNCNMARASKGLTPTSSPNPAQIGRELLAPIAAFLMKSGLSRVQLLSEFRSAIRHASGSKLKVTHMRIGEEASSIVNRWLRDPMFLNSVGRPAELSLRGARSITALVNASHTKVSPTAALNMLVEFGIVRKVATGKYRLVRRLVDFGHLEYLPFEPNFRFLVDATKVSTSRLRKPKGTPGLFWQCADNPRIDARHAGEFLHFAQQRGLSFMHEINDWLDEHESKHSYSHKTRVHLKRLGVGLFGICR